MEKIPCPNCGKEREITHQDHKRYAHHFCSSKCSLEYQIKHLGKGTCRNCKKEYQKTSLRKVCCSAQCRDELRFKKTHKCSTCGVVLVPNVNWPAWKRKHCNYQCRSCTNAAARVSAAKYRNSPHARKKRDFLLHSVLRSGGKKWNHVEKRPYPATGKCELCQRIPKKTLAYHHWDDEKPELGMWVCPQSHMLVNMYEQMQKFPELISKYLELKEKIQHE